MSTISLPLEPHNVHWDLCLELWVGWGQWSGSFRWVWCCGNNQWGSSKGNWTGTSDQTRLFAAIFATAGICRLDIEDVTKTIYFNLIKDAWPCSSLHWSAAEILIHAFVSSSLNYSIAQLADLPSSTFCKLKKSKLQSVSFSHYLCAYYKWKISIIIFKYLMVLHIPTVTSSSPTAGYLFWAMVLLQFSPLVYSSFYLPHCW